MSIFNKLAKANKNSLADKKRNLIGQFIRACKEVDEHEADKTSNSYKNALQKAKEAYEKIFTLTPELQKAFQENTELAFSETHLLGSGREDREDVKNLTAFVEGYLLNNSAKEEASIDLAGIVKPIKLKVPKYVDGVLQLSLSENEDGEDTYLPSFEEVEIYSLGATAEEVNNSLKKLVSNIEEKFSRQLESRIEELELNSNSQPQELDISNEKIIEKSLEMVKSRLTPEIKKFILSAEGQKTVTGSLALDRLTNITQGYIESIRDMNIQDGRPLTPLGNFLMTELTNKSGEKTNGLSELANNLYERVTKVISENPDLLENYNGNQQLDLKFQKVLHEATDLSLASIKLSNLNHQVPIMLDNKPTFVAPEPVRPGGFMNSMQKMMEDSFLPNRQEQLPNPALASNPQTAPALPSTEVNPNEGRVAEAINTTTSQYSNNVPKGTIQINPGDISF